MHGYFFIMEIGVIRDALISISKPKSDKNETIGNKSNHY